MLFFGMFLGSPRLHYCEIHLQFRDSTFVFLIPGLANFFSGNPGLAIFFSGNPGLGKFFSGNPGSDPPIPPPLIGIE